MAKNVGINDVVIIYCFVVATFMITWKVTSRLPMNVAIVSLHVKRAICAKASTRHSWAGKGEVC